MSKNITALLKEATKDLLTDETLTQIQSVFDSKVTEKVTLQVEAALIKQDEDYSQKLETLVEALDTDHTKKLERVVEALDQNNTSKLKVVRNRFAGVVNEQAKQFKNKMINDVSRYLDVYLEQTFPVEALNEAVVNKKSTMILNSLRKNLAVGTALAKESVKEAILDGKQQLDEVRKELETSKQTLALVKEQADKANAALILEQKTANLPEKKKAYAKRVLAGKSPKFITENIDYTLSLFDKKDEDRLQTLTEEAFNNRVAKEDSLIEESTETITKTTAHPLTSSYLSELNKY